MLERVLKLAFVVCTAAALALPIAVRAQQRDIMLVLDNSGSMKKNDPEFLTSVAVKAFIRDLDGDTHLGILVFDEKVDVAVPLSPLSVDTRARYLDSLSAIDFRGQWTHSSAALERALYELRTDGRPLAEKSIIFMTDGIVDTGDAARDVERTRWMQTELAASAAESGVRIFGIAFTDNADFQLIQSLAHRSGGEYFRAYRATDIEQVFQSIDTALRHVTPPAPAIIAAPVIDVPEPPRPEPAAADLLTALPSPQAEPPSFPRAVSPAPDPAPPMPAAPLPAPGLADADSLTTLPALDAPSPALPLPANPPAIDSSAPGPSSGNGASFLAELSTPVPEVVVARAADDNDEPPPGESVDTTTGGAATATDDAAGGADAAAEPAAGLPLWWLLAGGGGLAVLVGAGVFFVLRRRARPAPPSQVPKAFLNDLGGATDKSSHELGELPTVIGRLSGAGGDGHHYIVIDESTIGRRHAIVEYTEHAYWVADQNSLNGTFVNGHRIKDRTRLKHGDRLRFHRKEFEFVLWEMFETDRTEMSQTLFANLLDGEDDEATQMRAKNDDRESSPTSPTER